MARKAKTTTDNVVEFPEPIQQGIDIMRGLSPFNGALKMPNGGFDGVIVAMELQLTTLKQATLGLEKMIDAVKWQRDFLNQFKK